MPPTPPSQGPDPLAADALAEPLRAVFTRLTDEFAERIRQLLDEIDDEREVRQLSKMGGMGGAQDQYTGAPAEAPHDGPDKVTPPADTRTIEVRLDQHSLDVLERLNEGIQSLLALEAQKGS